MEYLKRVANIITSSIKFLTNPSEWKKSYELSKEYFPHFKTLIIDDIEIDKITKFISKTRKEEQVFQIICIASIINGAIAFVPGQMGPPGIAICRAVEAYMAFEIAKSVGLKPSKDNFAKILVATGLVTVSVIWIMKTFLGFFWSMTGGLMVPAEILATNFLGIFFWLAFEEIKKFDQIKSLSIANSLLVAYKSISLSYNLLKAQIKIIGNIGLKLKKLYQNIWSIINFKNHQEQLIKGDLFFAVLLANLLENKCESFKGFNELLYLEAWRKAYNRQLGPDATCVDIAKFVQSHNQDQMKGLQEPVKGKLFELYENEHENGDQDEYKSEIYDSPNHPRVDLKITNEINGKTIGIQLKASEDKEYILSAIKKYPDTPIIVPKGVAEKINHPLVFDAESVSSEKLDIVNETNFEKLLDIHHGEYLAKGAAESGLLILFINIMPFVYARTKRKISNEQFTSALKKFIPNITAKTIHRISLVSLIGPLYAFFLIAKALGKTFLNDLDDNDSQENSNNKDINKNFTRREFMLFFFPK